MSPLVLFLGLDLLASAVVVWFVWSRLAELSAQVDYLSSVVDFLSSAIGQPEASESYDDVLSLLSYLDDVSDGDDENDVRSSDDVQC